MRFNIPLKLPSLVNTFKNWRSHIALKKKQKLTTQRYIKKVETFPSPPLLITITRVGPKKLDDDNLAISCKYVRDEIARTVGIDDGSPLYTWIYKQRAGKYGVEVEITKR